MFKKILIANRGEIAVRILRAAQELGIKVVSICSEPDRNGLVARLADEVYVLEGEPTKVYLDADQIVGIAKKSGCEAIHPGYGFMAENAAFASKCIAAGLTFIGPKPEAIAAMGSKVEARRLMKKAGVPVVPGTTDPVTEPAEVMKLGIEYGYPIAIKAAAGGGGRGFRVVRSEADVEKALQGAQREGLTYFGSNEVYVEKYLERPHHVEVQIIGDNTGNVAHLFERDCSSQRRHQKLLEEAPAQILSDSLRARILESARQAGAAIGYTSAGTIETLVSGDEFYFLEVNTRVQVEHPITEMITGIDIVKEQIRVACGLPLSFKQSEVKANGCSIECRINAEDPYKNFMPQPGKITRFSAPNLPWVRTDTACYDGYEILPFYDSLIAKLVVWGRTREEAIARTKYALKNLVIEGVSTTIPFHYWLMDQEAFHKNDVDTTWVESHIAEFVAAREKTTAELLGHQTSGSANVGAQHAVPATPGSGPSGNTEIKRVGQRQFEVTVNQRSFKVQVAELTDPNQPLPKQSKPTSKSVVSERPKAMKAGNNGHSGDVKAEMHGLVKEILVKEGDAVKAGQRLLIFEAMKMESEILAHRDGKVTSLKVKPGQTVEASSVLMVVGE